LVVEEMIAYQFANNPGKLDSRFPGSEPTTLLGIAASMGILPAQFTDARASTGTISQGRTSGRPRLLM